MKNLLLVLLVCVIPMVARGAEEPSDDLLKELKKLEFTTLKDRYQVEKAEYDAKDGSFRWILKSKTSAPGDQDAFLNWIIAHTECEQAFVDRGKAKDAPRLRFTNGDKAVGEPVHPSLSRYGPKDVYLRVEVKVKLSDEVRKTATGATYK